MRLLGRIAAAAVLAGLSACAPKTAVAPLAPPGPPQHPDYVRPTVPADVANTSFARQTEQAWLYLQAGDLRNADLAATAALRTEPGFFPALTTSAYVALARKDAEAAVSQFSRIAEAEPGYAPALAGKGLALLATERNSDALEAFRAAVAADPSLTDIARRVDVLTLRGLQEELATARQAARSGQPEVALRAYRNAIAASPDSAFLYREIAVIERQQGQLASAVDHLRRATSLDPSDAASMVLLGDLFDQQGDLEGASAAYTDALRLEADPAVLAKRAAVRERLEVAGLPEQYRAIGGSPTITRGQLAALIGVKLRSVIDAAPSTDLSVITDIRGHWAERWIAPVARTGVVEAFANHTFEPDSVVRRVDLAQAAARILDLIAAADPVRARSWINARGRFTDLPQAHLAYTAASMVAAANVIEPTADGRFLPTQVVTGTEAEYAVDRLRSLTGAVGAPVRR